MRDEHVVVCQAVDEQQGAAGGRLGAVWIPDEGTARVDAGVLRGIPQVPLRVVSVVQPPVRDRCARDRRVEDVRAAQYGEGGQVPAE